MTIRLYLDGFEVGEIEGFSFDEKQWSMGIDLKEIGGKIEKVLTNDDYDFYFEKSRNHNFRVVEEFGVNENGTKVIRNFMGVRFLKQGIPIHLSSELKKLEWVAEKIMYEMR